MAKPAIGVTPDFARDYPDDPALEALVVAFARGNYAAVRAGSKKLEGETTDETIRAAARELRARTGADGTMVALFVIASIGLVAVWLYWIVKAHGSQ
jgi:CHASE3 domain sensor protein